MKKITSRQNPEIIALSKLGNSKQRKKQNCFLAEGMRTCKTLLESGQNIVQIYVTENKHNEITTLGLDPSLITIVTKSVMHKLSHVTSPSGIVGIFEIPRQPSVSHLASGIVLAHMTDPGNMGTLIRTCVAMGKKSVVIIEGVDPWNPKVIQASAGAIGFVDIFNYSWQELLEYKQDNELWALVVKNGKSLKTLTQKKCLLIIGSEAHGIPKEWQSDCTELITISMPGNTESLNAAVAGSIAMYELWSI